MRWNWRLRVAGLAAADMRIVSVDVRSGGAGPVMNASAMAEPSTDIEGRIADPMLTPETGRGQATVVFS